ncbi:MAG: DUF1292 domain-containing protein [Bacillota bacterium]
MSEKDNIVVLVDENEEELEFEIIDIIEVDEEEYAILLPISDGEPGQEAIILKIGIDENGEEMLYEIENDDEWEMVANAWQESVGENGVQ